MRLQRSMALLMPESMIARISVLSQMGIMLDLSAGLQEKTIRQAILQIKTEMCLGIIKELLATR